MAIDGAIDGILINEPFIDGINLNGVRVIDPINDVIDRPPHTPYVTLHCNQLTLALAAKHTVIFKL